MLKSQTAYMESLESIDPVAVHKKQLDDEKANSKKGKSSPNNGPLDTPAAAAMRATFNKLMELHTKLNADITPAKREPAIGKLSSKDITLMWKQLRQIFIPVLGLSTSIDVLRRHAEKQRWSSLDLNAEENKLRNEQVETLHMMMKTLHEPFEDIKEAIGAGFKHIMITLELTKVPKKKKTDDEETQAGKSAAPGTPGFAAVLKEKIDSFHMSKQTTLEQWCHQKGIKIPNNFFNESYSLQETQDMGDEAVPDKLRNQLFFVLHMEYMLFRAGQATLDMVLFADKVKQDGKLSHSKFIFPGSRALYKWVGATFGREDIAKNSEYLTDMEDSAMQTLYMGAAFGKRIDPEHLPPRNIGERIGDQIRKIPDFFRSDASGFAFRVTCASMSIAVINYLHDTQKFFQEQRLLWSMIMIAISMSRLAGQSTFNFALRVIGTAIVSFVNHSTWSVVANLLPRRWWLRT